MKNMPVRVEVKNAKEEGVEFMIQLQPLAIGSECSWAKSQA